MRAQLPAATAVRMSELVPPPRDIPRLVAGVAAALLLLAGAAATAATRHAWPTFVLLALSAVAEHAADRDRFLPWLRRRIGASAAAATAARGVVVTLAAARTATGAVTVGAALTVLACVALALLDGAAREVVDRERRPALLTRNVPLGLSAPASTPRPVLDAAAVASMPVAAAGVAAGDAVGAGLLLALAVVLAATGPLVEVRQLAALRRRRVRTTVTDAARAAFGAARPRVLLYFAGAPEEVYQADMWLAPLERCGEPAAVVLRDPEVLRRLAPTSLPVFCAEHNGTIAALPLEPTVLALFPTHSGNNLAMLRRPETVSTFVGHGDSDKPDSSNPYARVYDEIWVAGPVGRARYAGSDVGLAPDALVEVGRPQLPHAWPAPSGPLTLLYAPTWEGWGDDPHHTSLPHLGVALVRALLAAGVRVVYRPHPLTGVRSPVVRSAHAEVVATLAGAGAEQVHGATQAPPVSGDLLCAAVHTGAHPTPPRASWADAAPSAAPQSLRSSRHVVIGADAAGLHQTFAVAHALVGDVSSVVSDWLATGRPYAMPDTRPLGAAEFRARFPAAGGATVLAPDLAGLDELLAGANGGADVMREARRVTRQQVLGPAQAQEAFAAAIRSALARPRRRQPDAAR